GGRADPAARRGARAGVGRRGAAGACSRRVGGSEHGAAQPARVAGNEGRPSLPGAEVAAAPQVGDRGGCGAGGGRSCQGNRGNGGTGTGGSPLPGGARTFVI